MEFTSDLPRVSSRKALRKGQQRVISAALEQRRGVLTAQLPTGYGKTLAAASTYAALRNTGDVNRLLYIVSTDAQRRQFIQDAKEDFADAGLSGVDAFDISQAPNLAYKEHIRDKSDVFVVTIQALVGGTIFPTIKDMLRTGRWMLVVDEYHHYGIERSWGRTVRDLNYQFLLAMSATPERRDGDSAFGAPSLHVSYLDALEEQAVKKLFLHAYEYRVDAVAVNGTVVSFTTTDLLGEVGSADPAAIDRYVTSRKLRWSPKYISPLVSIPIDRLTSRKFETPGIPLQMIVGAMGCLHAAMVCEQIRSAFGDRLRIDWVGTGPNGRTDDENRETLRKFCPPKRLGGTRNPQEIELDVLVHVGMAGEGLDAVYVTEVVHLNPANITNQNDQENGRASRRMPGLPEHQQMAYINVDSGSPYAGWSGTRIMELFDAPTDAIPPDTEPVPGDGIEPGAYRPLPDEPSVYIANCELTHIDKGDPEIRLWAEHIGTTVQIDGLGILADASHPQHDQLVAQAIAFRRQELLARGEGMDRMSSLAQLKELLNGAVGHVAYLFVRRNVKGRFDKQLLGDIKRRISDMLCQRFHGSVKDCDETGVRQRYEFVKHLEQQLLADECPVWLA